ncbi:glycosyltransferase family 2 protein [Verrucomicrobium spinosum]|uniref:glycosyltransferase family 2 protein n=1 Tax=Verrucomicrobium spinosum TaxID=2736 RepID=UPI0009464A3C|nr:glycosyltransferase [Verrucomicrobium spinosum]
MNTSERPLVSICLPTLNAIEFLRQRTDSILSQTLSDWELIVCDSYSDDGTWEHLSELATDARVRLYRVPKEGLYAGWNECLRRVRGEFVYVATADDTMYPRCLEILAAPLLANPDVDMVVTEVDEIDVHDQILPRPQPRIWKYLGAVLQGRPGRISRETFALLLAGFPLGIGSITGVLIRRRLLEKTGLYPTDLSYLGDAEWALRPRSPQISSPFQTGSPPGASGLARHRGNSIWGSLSFFAGPWRECWMIPRVACPTTGSRCLTGASACSAPGHGLPWSTPASCA